jgi:hypothetical protein
MEQTYSDIVIFLAASYRLPASGFRWGGATPIASEISGKRWSLATACFWLLAFDTYFWQLTSGYLLPATYFRLLCYRLANGATLNIEP